VHISRCTHALVRGVPDSFVRCELTWIDRAPIDLAAARTRHAEYVAALERAGLTVVRLDPHEDHPDCPFVEDVLIEVAGQRILCNPGAPSRRGERSALLGRDVTVMPDSLRLDGGDVLQVGGRVFVGTSTRTDDEAVAWLRAVVRAPVVTVPLADGSLHLKTVATPIARGIVLSIGVPELEAVAPEITFVRVPPGEPRGANVLALPSGTLLLDAGAPLTAALLRTRGHRVETLDIEPFARAEAGLTCLSVLLTGDL
jgi:dimethylargininase